MRSQRGGFELLVCALLALCSLRHKGRIFPLLLAFMLQRVARLSNMLRYYQSALSIMILIAAAGILSLLAKMKVPKRL
jgi:hypothetical protein